MQSAAKGDKHIKRSYIYYINHGRIFPDAEDRDNFQHPIDPHRRPAPH